MLRTISQNLKFCARRFEHLTIPTTNIIQNRCLSNQPVIPIVEYKEIKELPNHPEKTLIDVREPKELHETGIIPTSINIPLGNVQQELHSTADAIFLKKYGRQKPKFDQELIFTCRSGKRAHDAAVVASGLGYRNVKNYQGSWIDWAEHEGLPK